jgi:arsenate reductase
LRALAKRAGGVRALVAPKRRDEAEGLTDAQLVDWLLEDPRRLRRPIIDTGDEILLGFTKDVRDRLSSRR